MNVIPNDPEKASPLLSLQQELRAELLKWGNNLAVEWGDTLVRMYDGALIVLASNNPDRFALAAHNFRELMEKFTYEKILHNDENAEDTNVHKRMMDFRAQWAKTLFEEKLDGAITSQLKNFVLACQELFIWLEKSRPAKKEAFSSTARSLEGNAVSSPTLEQRRVKVWNEVYRYFIKVCHHGDLAKESEFYENQKILEKILSDLLDPKPYAEQDELDAIIEAGEAEE